jgi:Tfp pilus assembly protein PilF
MSTARSKTQVARATAAPMTGSGGAVPRQALEKAKAAAEKALAIDPSLAEAHNSLAYVLPRLSWDWEGAGSALSIAARPL